MNRQKMDKQKRGPLAKITLQKLVDNIVYAECNCADAFLKWGMI